MKDYMMGIVHFLWWWAMIVNLRFVTVPIVIANAVDPTPYLIPHRVLYVFGVRVAQWPGTDA